MLVMKYLRIVKFIELESRMMVTRGWQEGEMQNDCLMGRVSVLPDETSSRNG